MFKRFRILVIGRANAGKTTILRRLCNTTEDPIIFSPDGKKIQSSTLDPSSKVGGLCTEIGMCSIDILMPQRGEHDIENEMIFESNPGFVFHDSRGFEAGGARELKLVQEFIERGSKAIYVRNQLHAIWYCIPTSDDRPITAAEKMFFNECGTGLVIVLWTKTESLDLDKILQLMKEGNSKSEAMEQAPQKAWADFEKRTQQDFNKFKYPPKTYVAFRKMHEAGADCKDLIEKTTATLPSEDLQQFFLSTQQNNINLCVIYGVKRVVNSRKSLLSKYSNATVKGWGFCMTMVLNYFPQFVCSFGD